MEPIKKAVQTLQMALLLCLMVLLVACSPQKPKLDAVSTATSKASSEVKAPLWQTLDNQQMKDLLSQRKDQGAFIWYNGSELVAVANFKPMALPLQMDPSKNILERDQVGYDFVEASPEAFSQVNPKYLVVLVAKADEEKLPEIKETLRNTLAGKAMLKLARDQFYIWVVS